MRAGRPHLAGALGPPSDVGGLRRFMGELWRQFSDPGVRAVLPRCLEVMSADVLHPDRYGPVMRDIVTDGPVRLADDH